MKVPQKLKKPYTAEEREHLKDIAKTERDVAIMELLYSTAGRIGEVVSINREDVDFPPGARLFHTWPEETPGASRPT